MRRRGAGATERQGGARSAGEHRVRADVIAAMRIAGMLAMIGVAFAPRAAAGEEARPQPRLSVAALVGLGDWDFGPLRFGGTGADIEVAAGVGKRGQVALEGFLALLADNRFDTGMIHSRLGVTGRWFPRAFHPDSLAVFEMYVEAGTGLQSSWWDGGERLTRHDVTLGTGMQMRFRYRGQLALRNGVQFLWAEPAPLAQLERAVCRGTCPAAGHAAPLDVGFMWQFGLVWGR